MPEIKVLKEFNACWNCGATETIGNMARDVMVSQGRLEPDAPVSLRKEVIPIIDPQKAALTVPVLVIHKDTCAKCGAEITIRVEIQEAPIQMTPYGGRQGPPPGMRPFFGRG